MKKGKLFSVVLLVGAMVNSISAFATDEPATEPSRVMGPCVTSAGADITTCDNAVSIQLNGSVTPSNANLVWTSSGTGGFDDNTFGATNYLPSAADISAGSVTLTITNQQNDGCGGGAVTDDVVIFFTTGGPTLTAGVITDVLCEDVASSTGFSFSATYANATGVQWSGGNGSYQPSPTADNMIYFPSAAEIAANFITIVASTTGNGSCPASIDKTDISVAHKPTAIAGTDVTMCASAGSYLLMGGALNAVSSLWSGGDGTGSFEDASSLSTTYYFSSSESAFGGDAVFTLTVYGDPACPSASNSFTIHLTPPPTITLDQSSPYYMCSSVATSTGVYLNALTTATDVTWTTTAGTSNGLTLNYIPTTSELSDGSAYITVVANDCGSSASTDIYVYFDPAPSVDPMTPINSTCGTAPIDITGTVNLASGVHWTGGTDKFDDAYSVSTRYTPSAAEVSSGSVTLTLEASGINSCSGTYAYGSQVITLSGTAPSVTVPADFDHCSSDVTVTVTASSSTLSGHWGGEKGAGFFEDPTSLTTIYHFDGAELTGEVPCILNFTSDNNAGCNADTKSFQIRMVNPASFTGISDQSFCSTQTSVTIQPVEGSKDPIPTTWTVTSGAGSLLEDAQGYGMTYTFAPADATAGSVTLTLSTDPGVCPQQNFPAVITLIPSTLIVTASCTPTAACSTAVSSTVVQLNGAVSPATVSNWTVTSGPVGTFGEPLNPVTTYAPIEAAGVVTLTLTATDKTAGCDVSSSTTFTVGRPMYLNYPNSSTYNICSDDAFGLYAQNVSGITWGTVGGTGHFDPSPTATDVQYIPGPAETSVTFTIDAKAEPGCMDQKFTVPVSQSIFPVPVPAAGADQIVCATSVITMAAATPVAGAIANWTTPNSNLATIVNPSDPATTITAASILDGPVVFTWTVREPHIIRNESAYCIASEDVTVDYVRTIDVVADFVTSAPAGDTIVVDVRLNDSYRGLTPTLSIVNEHVYYNENKAYFSSPGQLSFINRTKDIGVQEKVAYEASVCGITDQDSVFITLTNGAPFMPDTSDIDTLIQRVPETPIVFTIDFMKRLFDYNDNIDWDTYQFVSSTSGIVPDASSNDGKIKFSYTSDRAAVFTGTDEIKFYVEDAYGEKVLVTYYVEILPDYNNPSVRPDDFVVINAVSPNGDGVNDYMYVHGLSEYHNTVTIYNRWSEKVWEAEDYDNNKVRFEGVGNQKNLEGPLPEGSYFYVIKNDGKDENDEKTGLHSGYIEIRR